MIAYPCVGIPSLGLFQIYGFNTEEASIEVNHNTNNGYHRPLPIQRPNVHNSKHPFTCLSGTRRHAAPPSTAQAAIRPPKKSYKRSFRHLTSPVIVNNKPCRGVHLIRLIIMKNAWIFRASCCCRRGGNGTVAISCWLCSYLLR